MLENKQGQERYIRELEAKIEVLEDENAQLAERGEDTLLLGIVYEHINVVEDIDELLLVGLEKISLLKNIPFCAYCKSDNGNLVIKRYYFLQSNESLVSRELSFPDDVFEEIQEKKSVLLNCEGDQGCPVVEFETMKYYPGSILIIPSQSLLQDAGYFCFVVPENDKKLLSHVTPLIERVVEMITTRIGTLILMSSLKKINRKLDQKVREKTKDLTLANKSLLESEKKFRGLFNEALDMIHFTDAEGIIVDANRSELNTLKYSRDEYIGLGMKDIVDPAYQLESRKALARVFAGEEVNGHQTIMIAKDGSRVEVEVNAVPEMKNGKVVRGMTITRNISERRRTEKQLNKNEKMESIGILAGGIAHDFNNILAAILGNISLAQQYVGAGDDRIHSLLFEAEKGSLRAKELTQQLLTFSKGGEPVKKVSSIVDVIRDSAGFVLSGTNVRCTYTFDENLWPVAIDRGQISQVIQNLVINARHSMPMGGEIEITCENYMHDKAHRLPVETGKYIKMSIKDHGTGIPVSHIDNIFDPYFTTKQKGSGLGLAVTHSIIVKHHGHVEVESKDGAGTLFIVYLPASSHEEIIEQPESVHEELVGEGKVLVMDDEEMIRTVAGNMLSLAGYEVLHANRGEEAIEIIKREAESSTPVDAVILDLTIPGGMGGKDTADIIRKMDPDTKLIVTSGYSNDPVMASFREYGFCASIVKPYKFRELVGTVKRALS